MKKIILPLLLISTLAWPQQDSVFAPVPNVPTALSFLCDESDPFEYIKVEKHDYKRNHKASFCTRPMEMVDTIVFHHSETPSTDTPDDINEIHLNRGTKDDPWYMIAYSFVVNSPYLGNSTPAPVVTEGRPLEIVGAHAGTDVFVTMDDEQKRLWSEGKITCGKEGETPKVDPTVLRDGKIKANVTTIGIVVSGNYSPFSKRNPNGYPISKPRNPTKETLEMLAKLSCQLQKKYPRMKYLKPHNFYHSTSCPGNIWKAEHIDLVKSIAKDLGCEFQ